MRIRTVRTFVPVISAVLVLGAFVAAPAEAKKPKKCAPYASPDWATDAETTVLTDKATADAPVEVELTTEPGAGFTSTDGPSGDTGAITHKFHNVVVDTKAKSANLFVRAEYLPAWDYDLFLRLPIMAAVAYEADFNPLTAGGPTPVGGTEGGHAEPGASQIDGYPSLDCTGYTVDVASSITAGGAVTVKLWLEK
jgi:hypothetical protein